MRFNLAEPKTIQIVFKRKKQEKQEDVVQEVEERQFQLTGSYFLCPEKDGGMACWAFYKRRKKKEIIIKKEKETGWLL
jgi:hypothetical protein